MDEDRSNLTLDQVIALYLESVEKGIEPNRESILAEHSEFEGELRSFFLNHDAMRANRIEPVSGKQTTGIHLRARNLEETRQHVVMEGDLPFTELGEYSIVRRLGAGGMGQVVLAVHRHMNRQVAIKLLPPEMTKDDSLVKRFHREAQVAAQLSHPNIVAAYDAGQSDELHYLVLEYVDGVDLAYLVKQSGPLSIENAIRCVIQAGKGIDYAHQKGVIHRDIKPSNLLLAVDGIVKVLDMGLARWSAMAPDKTASELSSSGIIMGTIDYMAPEQASNAKTANEKSDLYSLGCTLYSLVHGSPLHEGDSIIEKLVAHRELPPPDLTPHSDDKSKELNDIFHKMVARDPTDRFDSIQQACQFLQEWQGISDNDLTLRVEMPKRDREAPPSSTVQDGPAQAIDTTRMTQSPRDRTRSRQYIGAVLGVILLITGLSVPFTIKLFTPDGTLVVKCFIKNAVVEIDGKRKIVVQDPTNQNEYVFDLPPGEHRVRVTLEDGTEIKSGSVVIQSRLGKLFEVKRDDTKRVETKKGFRDPAGDPEPTVHTVAQDGSAEHQTILSAIQACKADHTIRVLDDSDYVEHVPIEYKGLTIEFVEKAHWKPVAWTHGAPPTCLHVLRSDVTIRGVNFLLESPGFGIIAMGKLSNVRIEDCTFEGPSAIGISLQAISYDELPPIVTGSRFNTGIGVQVSGAADDQVTPFPSTGSLIYSNTFQCAEKGIMIFGELHDILIASNTFTSSTYAGIQFQHLLPKSHNIMAVNNTVFRCGSAVRIWENGEPDCKAQLVNNLTLRSEFIDWLVYDSRGGLQSAREGDGEAYGKAWTLRHNVREGNSRPVPGWIPPSESDLVLENINVLSRDPTDPDFLRLPLDPPVPLRGAGRDLPDYVGAVPPVDSPAFDWEDYYSRIFVENPSVQ